MSQIILDLGSGNTCKNDSSIIETMIKQISEVNTGKHDVVLKWQLFKISEPNIPLEHNYFEYAYYLSEKYGMQCTASVFDYDSLRFLMRFKVPFVKIANRPDLYDLIKYIPVPIYVSIPNNHIELEGRNLTYFNCISRYPATIEAYEKTFTTMINVSDHTVGWELYNKYKPERIEKHFVHNREQNNPDAGLFSVTQDQLAEIL